jgi:cyclopropane-fatty-acyl-phospholipid synthase
VSEADVTGITLSEEQHTISNDRAADANLGDRVRFHLQDYREATGRYDRIVSVGMFEHVGRRNYPDFLHWERAREPKALRERELGYRRVVDASDKDAVEKRNG